MSSPMLMGDAPGRVLRGALISFLGLSNHADRPTVGVEGWARFLDWCRQTLGVEGAFAIDPSGLVIAHRGPLKPEVLDELSARLGEAVGQAHRLAEQPDEEFSLVIRYGGRWVTVLRLPGDPVFKVALVSSTPVHPALLQPDSIVGADWQRLMRWVGAPTAQEGAFLVDERGLMVAQHGTLDELVVQGIGSRLSLVYDQIDRIRSMGRSRWIAIYFDQKWLVSVRVKVSTNKHLVFGAVGTVPVHPGRIMGIKRVLRQKLKSNPNAR